MTCRGDALSLAEAGKNLVNNALRHGAPPVTLEVRREGADAVLAVRDRGPGMPEALWKGAGARFDRTGAVTPQSASIGLVDRRRRRGRPPRRAALRAKPVRRVRGGAGAARIRGSGMRRLALALALLAAGAEAQPAPEATARFGSGAGAATPDGARHHRRRALRPAARGLRRDHAAGRRPLRAMRAPTTCTRSRPPPAAAPRRSADLIVSSAVDLQVKLVNDGCAQPHRSVADRGAAAGGELARRALRGDRGAGGHRLQPRSRARRPRRRARAST